MDDDSWLDSWNALIAQQSPSPAILELGCGSGRDTRWLVQHGYRDITATDLSIDALVECAHALPSARLVRHDLPEPLPFADTVFDAVIGSLCLHYFAWDKTQEIVREVRRCLKPGGLMLCRLNSTRDVHHGAAGHPEIEHHYYAVDGSPKRFFDEDEVVSLFESAWERVSLREVTIDRYEKPKAVWEVVLRKR